MAEVALQSIVLLVPQSNYGGLAPSERGDHLVELLEDFKLAVEDKRDVTLAFLLHKGGEEIHYRIFVSNGKIEFLGFSEPVTYSLPEAVEINHPGLWDDLQD